MNKYKKLFLAITGAFSLVFDIATPVLLVMLILNTTPDLSWGFLLILSGIVAMIYRGSKHLLLLEDKE